MELRQAKVVADRVVATLRPYCERIEVAGSIRRQRPLVHDIDIVLMPSDHWGIIAAIRSFTPVIKDGPKIKTVTCQGAHVDIYVATPETWATLLLIRTGSKEHNIRLCQRAHAMGLRLHADGSGLFRLTNVSCEGADEVRVAGDTEASIFAALGLSYKQPQERN